VPPVGAGFPRCGHCRAPLPWVVGAAEATFAAVAEAATIPVLVDLAASWCRPCRTVAPVLEDCAGRLAGRIKLVEVNVDESPAIASRFVVLGLPTLLLLVDGAVVARRCGEIPAPELRDWLAAAVGNGAATDRPWPPSAVASTLARDRL
jgi:thioredoxin 2